ncbi:MAG: hypothetical protein EBY15_13755, partial [Gammaproteobacteria bacterium]|nr:hypothetical protein [Gammaproteobacteria bacterium]NDG88986.1 hypothetical protein [Gammaproteobacteria bacterium]
PANDEGRESGGETPETQRRPLSAPESAPDQPTVIPQAYSEPFEASIESTSEATPDQGSQGSLEESDGTTPRRPSRRRTRSRRDRRVPLKSGNTEPSTSAEGPALDAPDPTPKAPTFEFSDD